MKNLFVCAFALLGTITLFAQEQKEVQNLPVLQEWYSWKGDVNTGANISYLPGFDSLGGGMNAITQGRTDDRVWYNRFPFDTTEQFRWKNQGSYAVVQLDFNNDGIHDYIDAKGRIYAGIKKGAKPNPEPVRSFSRGNIDNPFVSDMNGDGFQDILMWNSMTDCEIDFGANEWLSMKRTKVSFPLTGKFSSYIGGYTNEVNKPRIIVYVLRDYFEGFYLYGIRTENKGDSVQVFLDELDKIEISKLYKDEPVVYSSSTSTVFNKITWDIFFVAGLNKKEHGGIIYRIFNDKLNRLYEEKRPMGNAQFLYSSADKDSIPDYLRATNGVVYFYSGLINKPTEPIAQLPITKCFQSVVSINDVNNDGINDFAVGGSPILDPCFSIYLGIDLTVNVTETESGMTSFLLQQNEPNPVQKDGKTLLPITVNKTDIYTIQLYNVQGIRIKELYKGELQQGEIKLPLNLQGLSAGMYIVKMSNGISTRERAIIIGE